MSNLWPKFRPDFRCPSCQHFDWQCRYSEKVYICMRQPSERPSRDGGWYHRFSDDKKPLYIPARKVERQKLDIAKVEEKLVSADIDSLAKELGVTKFSLMQLDVKWSQEENAWTFPMQDGDGNVVGYRTRYEDGSKRAIKNSRQGIFVPDVEPQEICFVPEGASDVAAFLSMGLYSVGRPSCNTGAQEIKKHLYRMSPLIKHIVIVADNDELKQRPNGDTWRPGLDGARKLQKEIGSKAVTILVSSPYKDMRQMLNSLGARAARNMIYDTTLNKL